MNASLSTMPHFRSRVVPVIVVSDAAQAVPLAHALLEGGIDVMEITLRHAAGLAAIEEVAKHVPQMVVGAGTVTHANDMQNIKNAGAAFALSPGMTPHLIAAAQTCGMAFVPGVMTPSEVLTARDHGFELLKLFPAAQAGGVAMLKALAAPLAGVRFCPTGGIGLDNMAEYLALPNVAMVGGSWITPLNLIEQGQWARITELARQATAVAQSVTPS